VIKRRDFIKTVFLSGAILLSGKTPQAIEPGNYVLPEPKSMNVLVANNIDKANNPLIQAFTIDFYKKKVREIWRAKGIEQGFRNIADCPVIADIDGDGINELLAGDRHRLLLWKPPQQSPLAVAELEYRGDVFTTVSVGDANQDGRKEIFVGTKNKLHLFQYNGGKLIRIGQPLEQPLVSRINNIRIGDADNDGTLEILVGGRNDPPGKEDYILPNQKIIHIFTMSGNNDLKKKAEIISPVHVNCSIRIADANNDGENEVVISGTDTSDGNSPPLAGVFVFKYNRRKDIYEKIAEHVKLGKQPEAMNVGDVDNDGLAEIVVANSANFLKLPGAPPKAYVLKFERGNLEINWEAETRAPSHFEGIAIGDVDNDGKNEFTVQGKVVYKYNPKTKAYNSMRTPVEKMLSSYAAIGNLNLK